jgi:hypothetical protein
LSLYLDKKIEEVMKLSGREHFKKKEVKEFNGLNMEFVLELLKKNPEDHSGWSGVSKREIFYSDYNGQP